MDAKPVVSIVKCRDYSEEGTYAAAAEAVRLAGLEDALVSARSVLLKPNLLSARKPDDAVTTHPSLVLALGRLAQEAGCRVRVGDSPPFAGESADRYARLCDLTGISAAARDLGVPIVRFEEEAVPTAHPDGRFYRTFELARAVLDADVVVSISKLKTHGLTMFTGAVKNVFGCVPGIRKGLFHVQAAEDRAVFAQMLVDLWGAVRPAVNVVDAVVAMEGEGPSAGRPRPVGVVLASSDAVALDAAACVIVGIQPLTIDTTRLGHEQGLGCGDLDSIEIRGEPLANVQVEDFRLSSGKNDWHRIPYPIRRILRRQLVAAPHIDSAKCAGCGDCADACPVDAISPGSPPSIDLSRCIRCYCCHEVCSLSAAKLKLGWLGELVRRIREKR